MARVKRAVGSKKHRKQVLERAKGYYGNKSRSVRAANEQVMKSGQYAFRDRRAKKGEFRRLWIQRINAACRLNDISYSRFIAGLERGGHRSRSQDAGRSGRHRRGGVHCLDSCREGGPLSGPLTYSNPRVQRLRRLLGRRSSRYEEVAFVVEGLALLGQAIDAGWEIESCYVAPKTVVPDALIPLGVEVHELAPNVLERAASTESPQPIMGVLPMRSQSAARRRLVRARGGSVGRPGKCRNDHPFR